MLPVNISAFRQSADGDDVCKLDAYNWDLDMVYSFERSLDTMHLTPCPRAARGLTDPHIRELLG